ncbi:MAG: serine/threonine protein kinase [Gammaproteobacteria bacterium]|nr:serine/threonine protein kinase [Gammaproteobacteria bacterium]
MSKIQDYLPNNTIVDQFKIIKVIGGGGFSIVYLAEDTRTGHHVVLKEYFPAKLGRRAENMDVIAKTEKTEKYFKQGRKLFFQEASVLAALDHPSIVQITGFCQAHETIYTAMSYERGISLQAYIKKADTTRSEKFLISIFLPILDALDSVHEMGLLHLDLKPGNIYLRQGKPPLLLDFGAAHKLMLAAGTRMFPVVSHGFSPPEQSKRNARLGPWSDLYAIGATIRACIDSKPPPSAKERIKNNEMVPAVTAYEKQYSNRLLKAIDWAMNLEIDKRPQSIKDFSQVLRKAKSELTN